MRLDGQRVVLVGATSGIGLATARRAVAEGAEVVVSSRSSERVRATVEELGTNASGHAMDATDEDEVADFFDRLGAYDHLAMFVPTAPDPMTAARQGRFLDMSMEDIRLLFGNRFWSQVYCVRYGAGSIRAGGSITFMSGLANRKPRAGYTMTATTNGALEALAKVLAIELSPVRVNAVGPGYIRTPVMDHQPKERKAHWKAAAKAQPVPRLGEPEEVADSILYLMTNGFTTGTVLQIDGGFPLT